MEIRTVLADLPEEVGGYTVQDADDFYTIILNSRMNRDKNVLTYRHELRHIIGNDFKENDANEIEKEAHGRDE